ncbi:DUF4489 domain-containing protein [Syntrophomonas erecta]
MSNYKMDPHCPHDHHDDHCRPVRNQVILNCGTGSGVILPSHSESRSQLFNPYVVAVVALDTTGFKNPTVKLDFSSIITYKEDSYYPSDLRLTFQLSKVCNGAKVSLGTWNFERFINVESYYGGWAGAEDQKVEQASSSGGYRRVKVETVDSFGFTWCECEDCPGCCHYMVELINVESKNVDFAAVTNAMINAMAVGPQYF